MSDETVLKLEKRQEGDISIVSAEGKIDALTAPALKKMLLGLSGKKPQVICDFKKVTYISSAGVGALIEFKNNAAKTGGNLVLCSLSAEVTKVFQILGFTEFFKITSDLAAAKKGF